MKVATVVTHARVRGDQLSAYSSWQEQMSEVIARAQGFVEFVTMPPTAEAPDVWSCLVWFTSADDAHAWLRSAERVNLMTSAASFLVGAEDVQLVTGSESGALRAPASAVIVTTVRRGAETTYRAWQHKMAAAVSQARGLQGYRFEPPTDGFGPSKWVVVLRFDSHAHLDAWLDSSERRAILAESAALVEESHARIVHSGFDQWFHVAPRAEAPPAWKMGMIVLLVLYPVVALLDRTMKPFLLQLGTPPWLSIFLGNVVSVTVLNRLVPRASHYFRRWLRPEAGRAMTSDLVGAAVVVALYAAALAAFAFPWNSR